MNGCVDICNMALDYINVENITSLDENTKQAKKCNFWYEQVRKSLLLNLNATFSIKRAILVEDASYKKIFGYEKAYKLPKDCLKVISLNNPTAIELSQQEGEYFFCNVKNVCIRYLADIKEVNKYDAEFADLFALSLATKICLPLTNDYEKLNYIKSLEQQQYITCSTKYGNDNKPVIITNCNFRHSRYEADVNLDIKPLR
nr:MAG TPA: tail tubular protein [Caudoviricetes sp.]